jgi:hypothetical protein
MNAVTKSESDARVWFPRSKSNEAGDLRDAEQQKSTWRNYLCSSSGCKATCNDDLVLAGKNDAIASEGHNRGIVTSNLQVSNEIIARDLQLRWKRG